ncbi:MAG: hypothetical protein ACRDMV_18780 [Streptosporangiales bacterium]
MAADPHTIVVTVLVVSLLLILVSRSWRFFGDVISLGAVLGLLVGAAATVLAANLI